VLIPEQKRDHVSVFMELSRRHGDFAIAGLACYAQFEKETVRDARLVYFGSEVKPTLGSGAMAAITGKPWSQASREAARAALADDLDPIDNTFGSPATKLHLQRVLTERALDKAQERATNR
jgi:aerobic carbon-monoxide dehydrogenase medium subunit